MIVETSLIFYKIQSAKRSAINCRPIPSAGRHLGRYLPIAEPNSEGCIISESADVENILSVISSLKWTLDTPLFVCLTLELPLILVTYSCCYYNCMKPFFNIFYDTSFFLLSTTSDDFFLS